MPKVALVQESYQEMFVMRSEAGTTLRRQDAKRSWMTLILTAVQRGSLRVMRERADAMNQGIKDMTDIFTADMVVYLNTLFNLCMIV